MAKCQNLHVDLIPTCLSANVRVLITETGLTDKSEHILSITNTIDWQKFENHCLSNPDYCKHLLEVPKDMKIYANLVKHIAPCLTGINQVYSKLSNSQIKYLENSLHWSNFHEVFIKCYELTNKLDQPDNTCSQILAILILTAYIERALGNLYLLKGKQVPFLIKDLINSKELRDIIGVFPVLALRIMMGSPLSLNIRNILWHGFASPQEIDPRYSNFLLAIVSSLDNIIKIENLRINFRKQFVFNKTDCFTNCFPVLEGNSVSYKALREAFAQSSIVYCQMLPYWTTSLELFKRGKWGESLFLILPALENCFRVLFGTLNNCRKNIFTAENEILYLTFDEMLAEKLQTGEPNNLRDFLGDNFLEMFLDLLMYEDGPRVRDRISHGEVNLSDIPEALANHILHLSATLCYYFYSCSLKEGKKCQYLEKLLVIAFEYESKHHPISILKQMIIKIIRKLDEISINSKIKDTKTEFEAIRTEILHSIDENELPILELSARIEKSKTLSLYSTHQELLITKATRQIANLILNVSSNINDTLLTREALYKEGKLRSRQRLNYVKMLESLITIKAGLEAIMLFCIFVLFNLKKIGEITLEEAVGRKFFKFLKKLLQCVENLNTWTNINNNQWDKCCLKINLFMQYFADYKKHSLSVFLIKQK